MLDTGICKLGSRTEEQGDTEEVVKVGRRGRRDPAAGLPRAQIREEEHDSLTPYLGTPPTLGA